MSGRNPPSYCTLKLIAMQGHQQKGRQTNTSSNNKDKFNTIIIETSTAEDHDDENLHNPSTRPRYSPGSRRRVLFRTFSALVANPKKTTLYGGQSRSWSAERRKKKKKVWQRPHLDLVVSHIQRIFCQPEKNYFTWWPIPLVVC